MKHTLLAAALTLSAGAALAQQTEPRNPAPQNETPATSTTQEQEAAQTSPSESAEPNPAEPSTEERVATTEGKVTAVDERVTTLESDVGILKKVKLSGYVQGRYSWQEKLEDATGAKIPGTGSSLFNVRRGRLKATYTGDVAQFMLQIDATPAGVVLKDAEATLFIPGTKQNFSLTAGQMKWPFGYETVQSSGDREFPERSRVIGAFFAGERDRGIRLNGRYDLLRLSVGLFDGTGTSYRTAAGAAVPLDNDKNKDVVGRLGFDAKWVTGGVSGWWGNATRNAAVATIDAANPVKTFPRTRVGADAQVYLDLLPFGGTAVKGEYIIGKSYLRSGVEQFGVPASGWYGQLIQNVGASNAVAVRYDYFDGESGRGNAADLKDPTKPFSRNAVGTLSAGLLHYWSDIKLSVFLELPVTATPAGVNDPADTSVIAQLQAKF